MLMAILYRLHYLRQTTTKVSICEKDNYEVTMRHRAIAALNQHSDAVHEIITLGMAFCRWRWTVYWVFKHKEDIQRIVRKSHRFESSMLHALIGVVSDSSAKKFERSSST